MRDRTALDTSGLDRLALLRHVRARLHCALFHDFSLYSSLMFVSLFVIAFFISFCPFGGNDS